MSQHLNKVYNRNFRNKRRSENEEAEEGSTSSKKPALTVAERVRRHRRRKKADPSSSEAGGPSSFIHHLSSQADTEHYLNSVEIEAAEGLEDEVTLAAGNITGVDLANSTEDVQELSGE